MDRKVAKITLVVVCLLAAGLLLLWNAGMIGARGTFGALPSGANTPGGSVAATGQPPAGTLVIDDN